MPKAESTIEIAAPIDVIWSVMNDLPKYGEWNPFVVQAESADAAPKPGGRIVLRVKWQSGSGGATAAQEVLTVADPAPVAGGKRRAVLAYKFVGGLASFGLVRSSRVQTLDELDGGRTRYTSTEVFHGLLAMFVPLRKVQAGFDAHAAGLRARAETLATQAAKKRS
jgi:hypothetical protein